MEMLRASVTLPHPSLHRTRLGGFNKIAQAIEGSERLVPSLAQQSSRDAR